MKFIREKSGSDGSDPDFLPWLEIDSRTGAHLFVPKPIGRTIKPSNVEELLRLLACAMAADDHAIANLESFLGHADIDKL